MTSQKPKRIIIDCDTGVDDAMAIIFALKSHLLIVDSITTVNGNVSVEQVTVNTLKILEFMKRDDIPVAMGASKPWVVEPVHSKYVFGEDGLGNMSSKLPHFRAAIDKDAVSHILNTVANGSIDAIVAIGPLTNIANAYKKDKELMNSVKQLIVMGGAINVKGNITEFAEFNFYCDPHAADYLLTCATNITLIPLDVTTQIQFYENDIEKLKTFEIKELIKNVTKNWFNFSKSINKNAISLHDPLTVGYAINKYFLNISSEMIKITLTGKDIGKCTLIKDYNKKNSNRTNVALETGKQNFKNYFSNVIQ